MLNITDTNLASTTNHGDNGLNGDLQRAMRVMDIHLPHKESGGAESVTCLLCAALPPPVASHRCCHRATLSEEKPKEGVKTENDRINLKVVGHDGSVVQFKIKMHTPLSKLMKAYCERQGLSMRQIRFRFDGQPINETDTPAQLEMEDEDTIDGFQQRTEVQPPEGPFCALHSLWNGERMTKLITGVCRSRGQSPNNRSLSGALPVQHKTASTETSTA
ncbi:uncharacterized protein LOC101565851 [Octodon degus]|uniref:Uncharacterized protein LOC101565851 n=1 Tax=Octodon degus TaxID=10160 RepID=A0A6P3EYI8_OCTDE|nr:uncharacterized protein LOC101565851 [Octodon degus]